MKPIKLEPRRSISSCGRDCGIGCRLSYGSDEYSRMLRAAIRVNSCDPWLIISRALVALALLFSTLIGSIFSDAAFADELPEALKKITTATN